MCKGSFVTQTTKRGDKLGVALLRVQALPAQLEFNGIVPDIFSSPRNFKGVRPFRDADRIQADKRNVSSIQVVSEESSLRQRERERQFHISELHRRFHARV